MDLRNKVVMVTGASSGIGEATARAFSRRGARVVITSHQEADLQIVADSIDDAGGCAMPIIADFSEPTEVEGMIARAEDMAGPIDVLVNNAGVGMRALIGERPTEDMRFLFDVNFFAMAALCNEVVPRMASRGTGRIINVSSAAGQYGCAEFSAYSASKGAMRAYTQALRIEARYKGIYVTEIVPISVRTAFFDNVRGDAYRPHGVVITREQVADCIVKCAQSNSPLPEVWPYRMIRLVFILNAIAPGLFVRLNLHSFAKAQRQERCEVGRK